jgi:mRNA interferase HigB
MRIISRRPLREFWSRPQYADAEQPLRAWFQEARKADWASPAQVKEMFGSASIVGNDRVVFNVAGNKYRLVVRISFAFRLVYVRFIGTHKQYDQIDAGTI